MGLVIASIHEERDQFRQRFGIRREATARQAAVKSRAT